MSSSGRLLFSGLWPLVGVLIALHMDDISALFPARSLKFFFLGCKVIYTVPLLLIFYKFLFPCPSVTWLALYQCSAMVEVFSASPAFFLSFFVVGGGGHAY